MTMRVAIAGAGNVGRSIAQELVDNGHQVMLIERYPRMLRPDRVPGAEWVLADACELSSLQEAQLQSCDVVIAATGDDKVNLVVSLLAKTEFAVPRVVARVNRAENEWLFTEQWGVDVAVSKPRLMAALVEEAVTVGDLVRLMTFRQGEANLVEITLPPTTPHVGKPLREVPLPRDTALVAIVRGKRVLVPTQDDTLEAGDELVFVCTTEMEEQVRTMVLGMERAGEVGGSSARDARRRR
jgi:trk system potassium uptake protein TrkA